MAALLAIWTTLAFIPTGLVAAALVGQTAWRHALGQEAPLPWRVHFALVNWSVRLAPFAVLWFASYAVVRRRTRPAHDVGDDLSWDVVLAPLGAGVASVVASSLVFASDGTELPDGARAALLAFAGGFVLPALPGLFLGLWSRSRAVRGLGLAVLGLLFLGLCLRLALDTWGGHRLDAMRADADAGIAREKARLAGVRPPVLTPPEEDADAIPLYRALFAQVGEVPAAADVGERTEVSHCHRRRAGGSKVHLL